MAKRTIEELLEKYVNDWIDEREKNRKLETENTKLKELLNLDHPEVAEAAKKATITGSHADLKTYLAMRRKYL